MENIPKPKKIPPKLKDEIFPCDEGEKNGGDVFFPIPSAFLFVCIHIFNLFQIGSKNASIFNIYRNSSRSCFF